MINTSLFAGARHEATTWPRILAQASTEEEVLDAVRDFLAGWTPYELAELPKECRPPVRFATAEEVVLFAFAIAQARCHDDRADPALVRMSAFFAEAAKRVAAVMSAAKRPRPANA